MAAADVSYNFTGSTVLITGAGGHLGHALAQGFAIAGARLILHVRKSDEEIQSFSRNLPGEHLIVEADLTNEKEVEGIFKIISDKIGSVDVLVNNAGFQPTSTLEDITGDDWDMMMSVNLKAPHLCIRELVTMRKDKGSGETSIINIASIEAESPAVNHSHYGASKGGLIQYTKAAALELGPLGFRVNAVSPGLIYRDKIEEDWPEGVNRYCNASPLGNLVSTENVTQTVLFLASSGAGGITGINLRVDKGVGVTPGY